MSSGSLSARFLDRYSTLIRQYDLLEPGQEQQLACHWQEKRGRDAANTLVTSHLRLAAKAARGYKGRSLPLADLIAEANLGLVIAASRFEPGHGSRFLTYALRWIKAAVHEHILRSWSLVKIGTTAARRSCSSGFAAR
ncbi:MULTISPECIES: sigma-70 family RNA polymerase sigma factor [unclassified Bradyrhizobium]|uniref:sigma-70 family RNA polymerase sigma factor n=1 Tax=unclassified Bradyrhizobium TaxID=2631580 RepID=UPI0028E3E9BA|nr:MULTISPECIES: sigma-70 family RNA polymerase sigma factor [unclassified Bradyrhizobium]